MPAATSTIKLDFMIVANSEITVLMVSCAVRPRIVIDQFGVGFTLYTLSMATMETKEATLEIQASSSEIHHLSMKRSKVEDCAGDRPELSLSSPLSDSAVVETVASYLFSFVIAFSSVVSKDFNDSNSKSLS